MDPWSLWLSVLEGAMSLASTRLGVSEAVAIVAVTLLARTLLMPFSVAAALRAERMKEALRRLRPELDDLKARWQHDPAALAAATMTLYRRHGIRLLDRLGLVHIAAQAIFGIGAVQAIVKASFKSGFLWIASLARPDAWITVAVALLMALGMGLMPGAFSEPQAVVMIVIAVALSVAFVAAMPSAVGIYWATSNLATAAQAAIVRTILWQRRRRAAAG